MLLAFCVTLALAGFAGYCIRMLMERTHCPHCGQQINYID